MSRGDTLLEVVKKKDIDNINDSTKYINISIENINNDISDYFIINGCNYYYSDIYCKRLGYVYVDYEIFKSAEEKIDNIIYMMVSAFTTLEKVRYIYISLGKILMEDAIIFANSYSNNLWGSVDKRYATSYTTAKVFTYVLKKIGINSEVALKAEDKYINKVYIDDTFIITDLFSDLFNIQAGFKLMHFDKYSENIEFDKKISYIGDNYNDYYIEKDVSLLDYNSDDFVYKVLLLIQKYINITCVGSIELRKICEYIFDKYAPSIKVNIDNLFINDKLKQTFMIVGYDKFLYGFSYKKNTFIKIDSDIITDGIKNNKIGLYNEESFILNKELVV